MENTLTKLTRLASSPGCRKISPALLGDILARMTPGLLPPQLLAGSESGDEAAVYRIGSQQAIVATSDFFAPMVDSGRDFGRIAATGAIAKIYAMGGTPLFALTVAGMPSGILGAAEIAAILDGGAEMCLAAGIPIAGGHSVDLAEPRYGLVVIGLINPTHLKLNSMARPGDRLVLAKPLGSGIHAAALRHDALSAGDYETWLASAAQLDTPGPLLACLDGVHALSGVGSCGLLGVVLDVCKGSQLRARLDFSALPLLPKTLDLIDVGLSDPAAADNWASYGKAVRSAVPLGDRQRAVLADPQVAGGLLVSCTAETLTEVLAIFLQQGFGHVSVIGELGEGIPGIDLG